MVLPLGACLGTMHEIAFADDADKLAGIVYHRSGADPSVDKRSMPVAIRLGATRLAAGDRRA